MKAKSESIGGILFLCMLFSIALFSTAMIIGLDWLVNFWMLCLIYTNAALFWFIFGVKKGEEEK